jgi:hypothetical protein
MKYQFLDEKGAHLHTLGNNPLKGTSTIVQVIAKNLTWWAAELAAVECLEKGEQIPTIRAEYEEACKQADKKSAIDALQKKYPIFKAARFAHFAMKNSKAKTGTDMHLELEKFVKSCIEAQMIPNEIITEHLAVNKFHWWAKDNVKQFLFSEAHCYSERMWTGGIIDCGVELKNGQFGILDFKSAKEAYDSMFIQVAGYDLEQEENGIFDSDGKKLHDPFPISFYGIVPFGAEEFKVDMRYNIEEYREGFKAAVVLDKIINK